MRWLETLAHAFIVVFFALSVHADPYEINTCQNWAPQDWDIFIEDKLFGRDGSNLQTGPVFLRGLEKADEFCAKQLKSPDISRCLSRLQNYTKIFADKKRNSVFSFIKSDKDYLDSQPIERMDLPLALKSAANGLPKNWKELAEKNDWQWILFDSQTGYPKSEARLIIAIPHDEYTQLLMYYGAHGNQDPTTYKGLQMITVEKKREKKLLEQPKVHFRAFEFGEQDKLPKLRFNGEEKCVRCHPSGPRAIVLPGKTAFLTQMGGNTTLSSINDAIIKDSKAPDYSEIYDIQHFPVHLPVGEKYECNQCHDGKKRSSLSFLVDRLGMFDSDHMIHHKVKEEKTMPKDPSWAVTENEREKMGGEIEDDYHLQLKKWLTEIKCDDPRKIDAPKGKQNPKEVKVTQ